MTVAGGMGTRLPAWLKVRLTTGRRFIRVRNRLREGGLHTVCESAACPNRNECWNAGTATFLILGNVCTRSCRFCNISKGTPVAINHDEPQRVADAVSALDLSYAIVTSVTRDDLPDGGADLFAETVRAIRRRSPNCRVEVLIPDFQGSSAALNKVLEAAPDVLNHNIETVPSLYPRIRPRADYERSLRLLGKAAASTAVTKTGLMLGLGERLEEVRDVLAALRSAGCDIVTLGQYLRPSRDHVPVERYYSPEEFDSLEKEAKTLGFGHVIAGPLVRSSYHAARYGLQRGQSGHAGSRI